MERCVTGHPAAEGQIGDGKEGDGHFQGLEANQQEEYPILPPGPLKAILWGHLHCRILQTANEYHGAEFGR